ncbi:MAG: hypothetical protein EBR86_10395 [Planctomycetia bacterium]|nr:hypothetical protein [Planctomycetia bacterium]
MARAGLWLPVEQVARALVGDESDSEWSGPVAEPRQSPRPPLPADSNPGNVARLQLGAVPSTAPAPIGTALTETIPAPLRSATPGAEMVGIPAPSTAPAGPGTETVARVSFDTPPPSGAAAATTSPITPARRTASPEEVAAALVASTRGEWTGHVRGTSTPGAPAGLPPDTAVRGPPAVAGAPAGTPQTIAVARTAVERQLVALGALGFEFMPADAGCPRHRCSCRLPADPSGQLQRVFQAADEDPRAALDQLLAEVRAWQRRMIALAPAAAPPAPIDGVRR